MPKPKLTPEEKKALKIAKKQEKKRKAEERKKQLARDQLQRELRYSALTVQRHEKEWRQMLIKIALPKMVEELQFAWNIFERAVDCKDFIISLLMDEIRDAEEQYMMNFRNHMENIEKLIEMLRDRLDEFKADYNKSVQDLQDEANRQVDLITKMSANGEDYLKQMIYGLEMNLKEQERQLKIEYISRIDDQELRYGEEIQRLRAGLENLHQKLWTNTEQFLHDFFHKTRERQKAHDALKAQDDSYQDLIARQLKKIINANDLIKKLREKLADAQKTSDMKINDLQMEKNYFSNAFLKLKQRLEEDRKHDSVNLRQLTVESDKATKFLKEVQQKGEHILQLGAICRKLETQKEKILPFPTDIPKHQTKAEQEKHDLKIEHVDSRLNLFWQRVGQANALRFGMNEERVFLRLQNKILKKQIHSLECDFCRKITFETSRCGNINVTEAALEMKKYYLHTYGEPGGQTFGDSTEMLQKKS